MKKIKKHIDKFFKKLTKFKFIQKYFVKINTSLIVIGFLFVLKLISQSFRFGEAGGGFISLGLPQLYYDFGVSFYFGIFVLLICVFLFFKNKFSSKRKIKLKLSFYIFILGIFIYSLFNIINYFNN